MSSPRWIEWWAAALAVAFIAVIPLSLWVGGEASFLRNWQIALAVALAPALWRGLPEGPLRRGPLAALAGCSFASVLVNQLFKFSAFQASGTDFGTVDWMLWNTWHGRFMWTPVYEVNHFAVHPQPVLLLLVPLHALFDSPLFLVVLDAVVLWAAVVPIFALVRRVWCESAALLACAAYLTSPWTVAVLDGGFRGEALYPLLGAALLWSWEAGRRRWWVAALLLFLGVKEDAALYAGAFAAGELAFGAGRRKDAALALGVCAAAFASTVGVLQPWLLRGEVPEAGAYGRFWGHYGATAGEVARGMMRNPGRVLADVWTSGWYRFFWPALFLPLLSRRALSAMAPAVLVLGTSSYVMMREYQWYYPVPMIAWAVYGVVDARRSPALARVPARARDALAAAALVLWPLVGGGYLRFPKVPSRQNEALAAAVETLPEGLCAQLGIFPRLPHRLRARPLRLAGCASGAGAVSLVNPEIDAEPFSGDDVRAWMDRASREGRLTPLGADFALIRGPLFEEGK